MVIYILEYVNIIIHIIENNIIKFLLLNIILYKIIFKNKIKNFNKKILVPGDKSLSIRWVLVSSLSNGVSKAHNLLMSEDVLAAIQTIKKLGVKVFFNNQICKIYGVGINGYKYKKNKYTRFNNLTKYV